MPQVKQILVATDFSDSSKAVVDRAAQLAESFGAKLHILHVVEEPFGYLPSTNGLLPDVDAFRESLINSARDRLNQLMPPEEIQRRHVQLRLRVGTPYVEVVRYARNHGIELIVIGTHGHGPMWHMLLGSVTEKVVRYAHCPVLTWRELEKKGGSQQTPFQN